MTVRLQALARTGAYLSFPRNSLTLAFTPLIAENLQQVTLRNHSSVFANRLLIPGMQSIVIGPYIIDALGGIRTLT